MKQVFPRGQVDVRGRPFFHLVRPVLFIPFQVIGIPVVCRKLITECHKAEADGWVAGTDGDGLVEVILCLVLVITDARHHEPG